MSQRATETSHAAGALVAGLAEDITSAIEGNTA